MYKVSVMQDEEVLEVCCISFCLQLTILYRTLHDLWRRDLLLYFFYRDKKTNVSPKKAMKKLLSTLLMWIIILPPSENEAGHQLKHWWKTYVTLPLGPQYLRSIYVVPFPKGSACTSSQLGTDSVFRQWCKYHLPFSWVSIQSVTSSPPVGSRKGGSVYPTRSWDNHPPFLLLFLGSSLKTS